ncbi:MAG: cation-transporting P-type ATPase [Spirochaetales bacterium]|nr:cation-transporting P-type ATPase [Spirochaetales bacterium]
MENDRNKSIKTKNRVENIENPWSIPLEKIRAQCNTDFKKGLTDAEIKNRIETFGFNTLKKVKRKNIFVILFNQFTSVIMLILAIASALSLLFGHLPDGIAIIIAILINAGIGFFMELKAVRTMESLHNLKSIDARVVRNNKNKKIDAINLVPGDIVLLEGGDSITADMRILSSSNLAVDESVFTGESEPRLKQNSLVSDETPLADRTNYLYKGTSVTRGSGKAVVCSTGMNTELGKISQLIEDSDRKEDPLEKRIDKLGNKLIWVIIVLVVLNALLGIIMQREVILMIELSIALAVAAVPEGLPIVESVALAKGMKKMADRKALVRRLPAVQTLGSITTIFTDKTGTLTENQMTVSYIELPGYSIKITGRGLALKGDFINRESDKKINSIKNIPNLETVLKTGVLCNNATVEKDNKGKVTTLGDPTEAALLVCGLKAGFSRDELLEQMPEIKESAFDPDRKMMATVHKNGDHYFYAVKGAPDSVLKQCKKIGHESGTQKISDEDVNMWLDKNNSLASRGLRVLGIASKLSDTQKDDPYDNLTFHGLIAMLDPPRLEVKSALDECRSAGIEVIMVTGDQKDTARHIGDKMGLISAGEDVVHGASLETESDNENSGSNDIKPAVVYARISPEQKLRIIESYKKRGKITAMSGDGVNDAPALKKADIGIAMGRRGEQVAKDAADIILLDDSFNSIVAAIRYGRTIFNNIRKFVMYLISGNLGEILLVAAASLLGLPMPLLPLQILYLNTINDVFPALALGLSGEEETVMKKPPRDPKEPVLTGDKWKEIIWYGILISASVFGAYFIALSVLNFSHAQVNTVAFLSISFSRLWHVFNMRDSDSCIFSNQIVRNHYVWSALGVCVVFILLALFIPGLSSFLDLSYIPAAGWLLVTISSLIPLAAGQIAKSFSGGD